MYFEYFFSKCFTFILEEYLCNDESMKMILEIHFFKLKYDLEKRKRFFEKIGLKKHDSNSIRMIT